MLKKFPPTNVPQSDRHRAGFVPEFMLERFGVTRPTEAVFLEMRALASNVIDMCNEDNGRGTPRLLDGVTYRTAAGILLQRTFQSIPRQDRASTNTGRQIVQVKNIQALHLMAGSTTYDKIQIIRNERNNRRLFRKPADYLPQPGIRIDGFRAIDDEEPSTRIMSVEGANIVYDPSMDLLLGLRTTLAAAEIAAASSLAPIANSEDIPEVFAQ